MKEKIMEAGIQLFVKKGFGETSVQDICDVLSVTKGTFYYYFTSKEELLMDIQVRYIDDICLKQQQILQNQVLNDKEKLFEIICMLIGIIRKQGASARIFFREMRHLNEERIASIIEKRKRFRLNMEQLIVHGALNGEFRPGLNAKIVTFGILGMTNWSYQWFDPDGEIPDKEVAKIFLETILRGIELADSQKMGTGVTMNEWRSES